MFIFLFFVLGSPRRSVPVLSVIPTPSKSLVALNREVGGVNKERTRVRSASPKVRLINNSFLTLSFSLFLYCIHMHTIFLLSLLISTSSSPSPSFSLSLSLSYSVMVIVLIGRLLLILSVSSSPTLLVWISPT